MMRLGYACINLSLPRTFRTLRLATLQAQGLGYLQMLVDENFALLADILRWNREHQIVVFRLSSELIPFGSHELVDLTLLNYPLSKEITELAQGMRLSTHPGHFTLPSAEGAIWEKSIKDLEYHTALMNLFGVEGDMIMHGGGVYGDRVATSARIIRNILSLPDTIRRRLRLENDERAWSVDDLLPICEATGVPLIVDVLHHNLNGSQPFAELPWERILATWQGKLPKLHYSEQDPTKRAGAHSEYVTASLFCDFTSSIPWQDYDVMLECKAKELALLRLREELATLPDSVCVKEELVTLP